MRGGAVARVRVLEPTRHQPTPHTLASPSLGPCSRQIPVASLRHHQRHMGRDIDQLAAVGLESHAERRENFAIVSQLHLRSTLAVRVHRRVQLEVAATGTAKGGAQVE